LPKSVDLLAMDTRGLRGGGGPTTPPLRRLLGGGNGRHRHVCLPVADPFANTRGPALTYARVPPGASVALHQIPKLETHMTTASGHTSIISLDWYRPRGTD